MASYMEMTWATPRPIIFLSLLGLWAAEVYTRASALNHVFLLPTQYLLVLYSIQLVALFLPPTNPTNLCKKPDWLYCALHIVYSWWQHSITLSGARLCWVDIISSPARNFWARHGWLCSKRWGSCLLLDNGRPLVRLHKPAKRPILHNRASLAQSQVRHANGAQTLLKSKPCRTGLGKIQSITRSSWLAKVVGIIERIQLLPSLIAFGTILCSRLSSLSVSLWICSLHRVAIL